MIFWDLKPDNIMVTKWKVSSGDLLFLDENGSVRVTDVKVLRIKRSRMKYNYQYQLVDFVGAVMGPLS